MRSISASVDDVLRNFLDEIDREAPGLVEALYLTGSLALGDYRPGRSDLDFVGIIAGSDSDALRGAAARHRARYPRPGLDGIFLSWGDLAGGPDRPGGARPTLQDGIFSIGEGGGARTPVTWHILAGTGLRCRGPALREVRLWTDAGRLAGWVRENLDDYWTPWVERQGPEALDPEATAWGVLGICRLHCTLAAGRIVSKDEAGRHGLDRFAAGWHPIIEVALSIHRGTGPVRPSPLGQGRDCLDFVRMAIAASKALPS